MDKYRVSIHTFGYYRPSITDAESDVIENNRSASLVYQIGEDYFKEANFGKLEDAEIVEVRYYPDDKEISINVEGYFRIYVEADHCNEAEEKADNTWNEADFGELEDIEYDTTIIRHSF